jgi:transcriptional regulator with XRE-family HTH domain
MPLKTLRSPQEMPAVLPVTSNSAPKPHLLRNLHVQEQAQGEAPSIGAAVTPEAAESFIENKRIGDRIKYLRQRKGMGLVELGRHTGLSASFLSQLETGRVVPTLRNLARIAMVFSKDLSFFFEPERPELFRLLRSSERQRQPQTGADEPAYFFESLGQIPGDNPIAPYVAEFLPDAAGRQVREHQHAGAEFLFVLSGKLAITHQGKPETLEEGDAVYFHAEATHSYRCMGDEPCSALILTLPESIRGIHTGARIPVLRTAKFAGDQRRGSAA